MTDLKTRLQFAFLLLAVSLFIFFTPFFLGQKSVAIKASVKQDMSFLNEMVEKYHERYGQYPQDMNTLVQDAREPKRFLPKSKDGSYNKTLFNPILKNGGDANNRQIVTVYSKSEYQKLSPSFSDPRFAGKTGYYTNGKKYIIYGHLKDGSLLQENGQILNFGNLLHADVK